jgi:hypothetical protein
MIQKVNFWHLRGEGEFVGGLVVKVYRVRLCMPSVYGHLIKNCLLYF